MSEPRVRWLEIELTYTCGMRCHNCNRMTQLLPGQPYEMISNDFAAVAKHSKTRPSVIAFGPDKRHLRFFLMLPN